MATEGIWRILYTRMRRIGLETSPNIRCLILDSGPLMILGAALIATDARAIHLRTPFFDVLWSLKVLYPLHYLSQTSLFLFFGYLGDSPSLLVSMRLPFIVLWLISCMQEILSNTILAQYRLEIPGIKIHSGSVLSSDGSSDGSKSESEFSD